MASMPELGSKISLISKADIRYEGQLFTVDPNECTIALANVRSYGTEDREAQFPIAPQNQVYDYILFRGSDIKDIRVVNNVPPVPNDPAIMQMHLPNQMGQQNFQPQFPVPVMGHMGAPLGQFSGQYNTMSGLSGLGVGAAGGQPPAPFGQQQGQPNKSKQASELNHGFPDQSSSAVEHKDQGSRSTTPVSLNSRKSPTADMAVQVNQKDGRRNQNQRNGPQNQQTERRDSANNQHDNRNQRGNNQNRGGWVRNNNNANNNVRGPNRPQGRRPAQQQQGFRQNQGNNKPRTPKTTIKFEGDYDFEQANNKFEELRSTLAKLKVSEEGKPEQTANGEVDKKDDSGNETGAGEQEQEEEEVPVCYDKAKSFFDNISCEAATDRTKGKSRNDWRLERKINSETFGVSSARRGGYYNHNRGGRGNYYRNTGGYRNGGGGGNNGGYRGGNNFRHRNYNQRNHDNGSTGIPQNDINNKAEKQAQAQAQQLQQSQATATPAPVAAGGSK